MEKQRTPKATVMRRLWQVMVALLLLATIAGSVMPVQTRALDVNGVGSGAPEGDEASKSTPYWIYDETKAAGYRFSLVDSTGEPVSEKNYPTYDVYSSSGISSTTNNKKAYRFSEKYNKKQLAEDYADIAATTDKLPDFTLEEVTGSTQYYTGYTVKDSTWGLTLPTDPEEMVNTWAQDKDARHVLLEKAWGITEETAEENNWAVIVETIYPVVVNKNRMLLTVSEMAIVCVWDGSVYSSSDAPADYWTAQPRTHSSDNTWAYMMYYTNVYWPMAMHLEESMFGLTGESDSSWKKLTTTKGSRGTAELLLTGGYGMMVLFPENVGTDDDPVDYTITYDPNGGTMSSTTQSYNIKTDLTLKAAPTVPAGYEFTGWKVTTAAGSWTSGDTYTSAQRVGTGQYGDVTLTAQWKSTSYTVTIEHYTMSTSTRNYSLYDTKTLTVDPDDNWIYLRDVELSISGYRIYSWEDDARELGYNDYAEITNNNTTICIYYDPYFTITLNHQSGTSSTSAFYEWFYNDFYAKLTDMTMATSETAGISSIEVPTRTGYTFGGYYTSTGGSGTQIVDASGNIKVAKLHRKQLLVQWCSCPPKCD